MKFSQLDVIGLERRLLYNRKESEGARIWSKVFNAFLNPRNPKHRFTFFVPQYLFIRSISFCQEIEEEIGESFNQSDLARVLYTDFLEYVRKTNDVHDVHSRLKARSLSPTTIQTYQTEKAYMGVVFEEIRGFEEMKTLLEHRQALKGEFLLSDMMEIYQDHAFVLENILEIVVCDFIDDYRKGLIKNPIGKIVQYL